MPKEAQLYRILDANFNRAKEGLRVCEDICRYVWDEKVHTRSFKDLRHKLSDVILPLGILKVITNRDIISDVGKATSPGEAKRKDINAVFFANLQRVKESLRVLEEITKLIDPVVANHVKNLRYRTYALEQKSLKRR